MNEKTYLPHQEPPFSLAAILSIIDSSVPSSRCARMCTRLYPYPPVGNITFNHEELTSELKGKIADERTMWKDQNRFSN